METNHLNALVKKVFNHLSQDEIAIEAIVKKYEHKVVNRLARLSNTTAVVQVDNAISTISPVGIKIEQPGTYYFTNDITWIPGITSVGIAIDIISDNVILDLNGYQLIALPPSNTQNIIGINAIGANITIKSGQLINMSFHGISAELTSNLNIAGITVQGSEYTNLGTDAFVTASGIYVEFSNDIIIKSCKVTGVNVTVPAYAGIQLFTSTNANVADCDASNFVNKDGTVTGFSYVASKQVTTTNCHSSGFRSHYLGLTTTFGHTVLGFLPTGCDTLQFDSCTATNLRGCCDDCHGMSIFDSKNITVIGFRANGIVDGDAPTNTGAKATGLEVYGDNIEIKFCVVENIFAIVPQDKQSCGFSAAGNNITFESCVANNVIVFDENRNPTNNYAKYGYGIGFGWAPDPRPQFVTMNAQTTTYLNCGALYCQVGFDTWNHIDGKWQDCKAENCNINLLQELGTTRIFSMDKCSELPTGMTSPMTITNYAANNSFTPPI